MANTRYALTLVFDINFVTQPADEGVRDHFEAAARDAVSSYLTRTVSGSDVVFLSVSRDSSTEQD